MAKPTVLPQWNTDGTNRVTPSSGQQSTGWTVGQAPPSSWFNWLAYHTYNWLLWCQAEVLSAVEIAAAAWEWTEYHIFRRPVAIYGYGPVAALLVVPDGVNTAIQTTGKIETGTLAATSTISTSANVTVGTTLSAASVSATGTISTSTNLTVGTAISAGTVDATGGVSGHGFTSLTGESELIHSAVGIDNATLKVTNTGASGSYALNVTQGHTQLQGVDATAINAARGVFTGSALITPLNLAPMVLSLPAAGLAGDIVIRENAGVTYLYHCDVAPSSWSRVALTRLY